MIKDVPVVLSNRAVDAERHRLCFTRQVRDPKGAFAMFREDTRDVRDSRHEGSPVGSCLRVIPLSRAEPSKCGRRVPCVTPKSESEMARAAEPGAQRDLFDRKGSLSE